MAEVSRNGSIVIIGAGVAGIRAANTLRKQGFGGGIVIFGDERHPSYERPPLSKAALMDGDEVALVAISDSENLANRGIRLVTGTTVVGVDPLAKVVTLSSGERQDYYKLLFATGAVARPLNMNGLSHKHIHYLRTYDDAVRLKDKIRAGKQVLIIGAGFVGLELAATITMAGAQATVVENQPQILMRAVHSDIADVIKQKHLSYGVNLKCDVGIESVSERGDGPVFYLSDGSGIKPDIVIASIGSAPRVDLAEKTGLTVNDGIIVDERQETSQTDIYAAGDCCAVTLRLFEDRKYRLESWRCALDQGALAAKNMLGENQAFDLVPWFWSDQFDLCLQVVGMPTSGNITVRRDCGDGIILLFSLDESGRMVGASGIAAGRRIAKDIKIAERLIVSRSVPDQKLL